VGSNASSVRNAIISLYPHLETELLFVTAIRYLDDHHPGYGECRSDACDGSDQRPMFGHGVHYAAQVSYFA